MDPSPAQAACFEAGIKFGSLYHQFAGTPVSPESAPSLGAAIEAAIENQPFCTSVTVTMRTDRIQEAIASESAEYTELTGKFMDVDLTIAKDDILVDAQMRYKDGYPKMELVDVRG